MNIHCTGCGGIHPRPGGKYVQEFSLRRNQEKKYDSTMGATAAGTNSKMATAGINWAAILPSDELATVPDRSSDDYMGFCEKVIGELSQKVRDSEEESKVLSAEKKITELMSQLELNESRREKKLSCRDSHGKPGAVLPDADTYHSGPFFRGPFRTIVEPTDGKDYLCKLRAESHLTPTKSFDSMNYRDLVLVMAGVHNHLLIHGRPVDGYEAHCLFVKRKSASFLYTNQASILYDRYVTDKILAGEFKDYPSSCSDASLEYFCDSYRRESFQSHTSPSQSNGAKGGKPWSGFPYPFCYFYNEGAGCHKKVCHLKHECPYCHSTEHRSKDCAHSLWKKQRPDNLSEKGSDS